MDQENELTISSIIDILRRRIIIIILAMVVAAAGAFAITLYTYVPQYTCSLMLYVDPSNDSTATISAELSAYNYAKQVVNTYIKLLETNSFFSDLAKNCSYGYTAEQLANIVSYSAVDDTEMIYVTVTTDNPQKSLSIAELVETSAPEKIIEIMGVNDVKVADPPVYNNTPSDSNALRNTALGAVIGLVIAAGLSIAFEMLDVRVKDSDDFSEHIDLPVLGEITDFAQGGSGKRGKKNSSALNDDTATLFRKNFNVVEAYNALRVNLLFAIPKQGAKKIILASAEAGEGKTTTVVNLAITLAQAGEKVIVVDCDLRKPRMHKLLKLRNKNGVSNYMSTSATLEEVIQTTPYENLSAITAGTLPPNPAELLSAERVAGLLEQLEANFDYILLDTSPVNVVSDALQMASVCDGVVMVAKYMATTYPSMNEAVAALRFANANIVGTVINSIVITSSTKRYYHRYYKYGSKYGYRYKYGYGYGSTSSSDKQPGTDTEIKTADKTDTKA